MTQSSSKMFAVMQTSFTPCDCGARDSTSVKFVTFDKEKADTFVVEENAKRSSAWAAEFEVEEVEVR